MPPNLRSFCVASTVAVLAALAGPAAAADGPAPAPAAPTDAVREQVRTLVRQAGEHMDRGDKAGAASLLEQARRLRPDPSLDYNLGMVYGELNQSTDAARAFERFLGAADPTRILPERIADARKRLSDYQKQLSRLRPRISLPPGTAEASLSLDDRPALPLSGGTLSEALWVAPGMHRVRVMSPGLRDYQVAIDVAAGESREVTGELLRDDLGAGLLQEPTKAVDKGPEPLYKKWWFWTAIGGGAAVGIGLIAAGAKGSFNHTAPGSDLDAVDLAK